MAITIESASFFGRFTAVAKKTIGGIVTPYTVAFSEEVPFKNNFTTGTAADCADQLFVDTRTLAGTSESLDLAASLTNFAGETITFAKIRGIGIWNNATTTLYKLIVGGAASNQFINWVADATDKINIGPRGMFILTSPTDGYAVTAATGDILKIDSGANTISYTIAILGTTV